MASIRPLSAIARSTRVDILKSTTAAGSGHPTSCLSAVELCVALFFGGVFRADLNRPRERGNDRFILSKGHAAPLLYALYAAAGKVSERELRTLRRQGSRLEGHPVPAFPYVDAPTGSLGQGLAVGIGMALAARMQHRSSRTYVLLGDSEMAEGSVWEALALAGHERLANLVAILDVNRLGQSGPTMLGHRVDAYAKRVAAFGWQVIVLTDGHDFTAVQRALRQASKATRPTMVIAKTVKGKGVSFLENRLNWHGKTLSQRELARALDEIGPTPRVRATVARPRVTSRVKSHSHRKGITPTYARGTLVAPRAAIGAALVQLAATRPDVVALDADVKNSTAIELFAHAYPRRFVETSIAEQCMASVTLGLSLSGATPVAATFAAFWARAFDQLRMAQYARSHFVLVGSHPGVHIGQDGPSQMGLEDVAMLRTLEGSIVLAPSDAVAAHVLLERALDAAGIVYLRVPRAALPVIYPRRTRFPIGGSITLRSSRRDVATVVAAGVTVHEALAAAVALQKQGVAVRVIDCYSIKPIDTATLRRAARATGRVLVAEDHRPEGGLADAVRIALGPLAGVVTSLAVRRTPHSATPAQALHTQHLDAESIVKSILSRLPRRHRRSTV